MTLPKALQKNSKTISCETQELDVLFQEIDSICDRVSKAPDIPTAVPIICELAQKIFSEIMLAAVYTEVYTEYQEEIYFSLNKKAKKLIPTLHSISKKTVRYLKKEKIIDLNVKKILPFIQMIIPENCIASIFVKIYMLKNIFTLLQAKDMKHRKFIEQFATLEKNGRVSLELPISLDELNQENNFISRIGQTHVGYSFVMIIEMNTIYNPKMCKEMIGRLGKANSALHELTLKVRAAALDDSVDPTKDHEIYKYNFDVVKYKDYCKKVCLELKRRLLAANTQEKLESYQNWSFDSLNYVLTIYGRKVPFRRNEFRAKVLEFLAKKSKTKTWKNKDISWDIIIKKIEKVDPFEEKETNIKKVYEALKA